MARVDSARRRHPSRRPGCDDAADAAFRADAETVRRLPIGYGVQLIGFFVAASMYAQTTIPTTRHRRRAAIRALSLGVLMVTFAVVWNYVTQPISIRTPLFEIIEYLVGSMTAGGSDRDGLSESKRHE